MRVSVPQRETHIENVIAANLPEWSQRAYNSLMERIVGVHAVLRFGGVAGAGWKLSIFGMASEAARTRKAMSQDLHVYEPRSYIPRELAHLFGQLHSP